MRNGGGGMAPSATDRVGPADLIAEASGFQAEVARQTARAVSGSAADPDLSMIGFGSEGIPAALARLERMTRRSVHSMQRRVPFEPRDPYERVNDRSRARGVSLELIVAPVAVRANPLVCCIAPDARVAFVGMPLLIIDEQLVVVPGPVNELGEATVWLGRNAELVARARRLWDRTWASSTPLLRDGRPPLTERQYNVLRMVADGTPDVQIARQLHISARTVLSDVNAGRRLVGATSRPNLVAKLMSFQL